MPPCPRPGSTQGPSETTMTDAAETTVPEPTFSDMEVAEFEATDKNVGRTIGVMLAVLFSLFVPLMLFFWLGVDTVSALDDDVRLKASQGSVESPGDAAHKGSTAD